MLLINDKVFVANMKESSVEVIDPATQQFVKSISVGLDPNSMVTDANGKLWVLCGGGFCPDCEPASLHRINIVNYEVELSFTFDDINESPADLVINAAGDRMYFINGNIFTMSTSATQLPETAVFDANFEFFYHLAIDSQSGDLYASSPIDFLQDGRVYRISSDSYAITDTIAAGVGAGRIYFRD